MGFRGNELRHRHNGLLIVIEGIDGTGKTTQAELLADHLRSAGADVLRSREPTDGPAGQRLRDSASSGRLAAREELDLFVEDRRQHVDGVLAPALAAGKVVIVDRYYLSTAAYQGARGLDAEDILRRNESFAPLPDLAIILELPPEVGRARVRRRGDGDGDLFEVEEELRRVAATFASLERDYITRIDAAQSIEKIHHHIVAAVESHPRLDEAFRTSASKRQG